MHVHERRQVTLGAGKHWQNGQNLNLFDRRLQYDVTSNAKPMSQAKRRRDLKC